MTSVLVALVPKGTQDKLLDDRMDLAVSGGLYIMPISFQISAKGAISVCSFESMQNTDYAMELPMRPFA